MRRPSGNDQLDVWNTAARAKTDHASPKASKRTPPDILHHSHISNDPEPALQKPHSNANDAASDGAHARSEKADTAVCTGRTGFEIGDQDGLGRGQDTELDEGLYAGLSTCGRSEANGNLTSDARVSPRQVAK